MLQIALYSHGIEAILFSYYYRNFSMALGLLTTSYSSQQLNNKPVLCSLSEKCWLCSGVREKEKMVMVVINNN